MPLSTQEAHRSAPPRPAPHITPEQVIHQTPCTVSSRIQRNAFCYQPGSPSFFRSLYTLDFLLRPPSTVAKKSLENSADSSTEALLTQHT
ncbi:hypothetical protein E2C01_083185 [Portunus trituberculatus]|uniref:Uncharacterized protein n=1 Tax=Portunus trituberculatus TaxID=210409 RepID=A0A5B7J0H7_PORTR|nr:hypothetical protein [Portunus trituberculatus]